MLNSEFLRRFSVTGIFLLSLTGLAACDDEPEVGEAVEEPADAVEDTAGSVGDAAQDAADETGDAIKGAGEDVQNAE